MNPKTVLVTGGAVRIGREIALHFARHGWAVALHYGRSSAEAQKTLIELRGLGVRAEAFQCDLGDEAAVKQLVPRVLLTMGDLDVLVNCASRFEFDDASTVTSQQLFAHMGPNLLAPVLLAQSLADHCRKKAKTMELSRSSLPDLLAAPEGAVVNLLDQKLYNLNPDFFSYTMTKAALAAATVMLAQSLAPAIRVNAVAPGLTLPSYLQDQTAFEKAHQVSVLGRSSDVADIAATVYFVATNRSMTGATVLVDGGQHLLALPRDISLLNMDTSSATALKAQAK
jgi:NAD(P)-dependent dehydrogenase (short-subunit alcohol dehydrogenase family)